MLDPGSVLVALQVALADVASVFSHGTQEGKDGFVTSAKEWKHIQVCRCCLGNYSIAFPEFQVRQGCLK